MDNLVMPAATAAPPRRRRSPRRQKDRSERSRSQILAAALQLFSKCGYHGTSIRDIARTARASTGNVYHHFPDKETIFNALLEEYLVAISSPEFPFNRALIAGAFPDDLVELARAARVSVEQYQPYAALVYVDVVEFEGTHIRRMYAEMASRFQAFFEQYGHALRLDRLRDGVSPLTAIMLVTRFFVQYFAVEVLFRVPNHFGKDGDEALRDIVDILNFGIMKS
jgi:TetR/AcrR family transcriptional regulator, acrAB operon repressor